jgi:hypothetical protein
MTSEAQVCHYRIYVYMNAAPPLGRPTAVSLCPGARMGPRTLSAVLSQVTCEDCQRFISQIGLDGAL